MNLYIPKGDIDNLIFILDMFIDTHELSEASIEDVEVARKLLNKLEGVK